MTKVERLISLAEEKANELSIAVQAVEAGLIFNGFRGETPQASMCSGDELILTYKGREMQKQSIIERMKFPGYITPDDF